MHANRTAPDDRLEAFAHDHFDNPRRSGTGYSALCPVPDHDDRSPSLSIGVGDNGAILLHCFGGCPVDEVLTALDLRMRDLYPSVASTSLRPRRDPEAAKWARVAERALEQQDREMQPCYWSYRAAMFAWAGCELEAERCLVHADLLSALQ